MVQEEDFVTQTYNVPLLDTVPAADVGALLRTALQYMENSTGQWSPGVVMALKSRLLFRKQFLAELAKERKERLDQKSNWDACIALLSTIGITRNLGKAVPAAFSTTVQRKLASTVPPRPMVITPFEEAFTILSRL